jgi:hypothetical protein
MRVATLQTYVVYMISRNEIGDTFEDTFGKKKMKSKMLMLQHTKL